MSKKGSNLPAPRALLFYSFSNGAVDTRHVSQNNAPGIRVLTIQARFSQHSFDFRRLFLPYVVYLGTAHVLTSFCGQLRMRSERK